ncbi:MAG: ATP phosphoribosyltransferase [Tenericutes bacterium]|nr:ATP phosphoribosyltransferase [Mycoplasmatota bacterium]
MNKNYLTIAIPKGRLGEESIEVLNKIGYAKSVNLDSRKLVFIDDEDQIQYLIVKSIDVMTYVNQGVADIGIVGKDNILEEELEVYELLDLSFGYCQFVIAGFRESSNRLQDEKLRVATKYPNMTAKYFKERNRKIEIIKLNGSVELAPLVGLSDVISDIVETGSTLKANGLEIIEKMYDLSAKLVSNRVSYRFKFERINHITKKLNQAMEDIDND